MPQPEMDIEDDERSVKPLVLFGHHMVTDGTNPPKRYEDAQFSRAEACWHWTPGSTEDWEV